MSFLFGKKKTTAEILREHQRVINRAMREMDREKMKMEQQEKRLVNEIKREAAKGNQVHESGCACWERRESRARDEDWPALGMLKSPSVDSTHMWNRRSLLILFLRSRGRQRRGIRCVHHVGRFA